MLVLSLWLIVRGMKKRKAYKAEGGVTQKNSMIAALVEKREVVVSFVALGLYVGLMGPIGFVPTTIQMCIRDRERMPSGTSLLLFKTVEQNG